MQANDFGVAGTRDTVTFCTDAGRCVAGDSPHVISPDQIDVTSPDASALMVAGQPIEPADTYVSTPSGVQSPQVEPDDLVYFGCNQVQQIDGLYTYAGCVYPSPTVPGTEVTEQSSNIDGIQVSASRTDQVSYGSGTVTSSGPVTMTLNIAGQKTTLSKGVANANLANQLVFSPKGYIGGFRITGPLTITGGGSGTASGSGPVTLPQWLGGGAGTLTFTTMVGNATAQNVQVAATGSGAFADLVQLGNLGFTYSVWGSATATLSDDGKDSITLTIGDGDSGFTTIGGGVNIKGSVKGTFGGGQSLDVTGKVTATIPVLGQYTAVLHANGTGMAACTTKGAGFMWIYSGTPQAMTTGRSTKGF